MPLTAIQLKVLDDAITNYGNAQAVAGNQLWLAGLLAMSRADQKAALLPYIQALVATYNAQVVSFTDLSNTASSASSAVATLPGALP